MKVIWKLITSGFLANVQQAAKENPVDVAVSKQSDIEPCDFDNVQAMVYR
jgi:hypothetical protein